MRTKHKQEFSINREFREKISKSLHTSLIKATLGYGKGALLARKTGIHYNTLNNIRKTGLSTTPIIKKLEKALA